MLVQSHRGWNVSSPESSDIDLPPSVARMLRNKRVCRGSFDPLGNPVKEDHAMETPVTIPSPVASSVRLTEDPALYGLTVRERGELVEFVSYEEARRRLQSSPHLLGRRPVKVA